MNNSNINQIRHGSIQPVNIHPGAPAQKVSVVATAEKTSNIAGISGTSSIIHVNVSRHSLNRYEPTPTDSNLVNAPSNVKSEMRIQKIIKRNGEANEIISDGKGKTYQQLANGACKDVLTDTSENKQYVYYLARKGNSSALKDLKKDVDNAHMIRDVIIEQHQMRLEQEIFAKALKDVFGDHIPEVLKQCNTFSAVYDNIGVLMSLNVITEDSLQELIHKMSSSEVDKKIDALNHLAINYEVMEGSEQINGEYTVRADRANSGNLDDFLTDNLTIQERGDLCTQMVGAISSVHRAGYLHCDLKPENILIDRDPDTKKPKLMLSDWGKTMPIQEDPYMVEGNWRFMPWEAKTSLQGEICSTAICMIKILERSVLKAGEKYLLEPKNKGRLEANKEKNRRGIETFLIESDDFRSIESNNKNDIGKIFSNRFSQLKTGVRVSLSEVSQKDLEQMGKEKDRYIDELTKRLSTPGIMSAEKANELNALLKAMTHIDKEKRPQLAEVLPKLKDIFKTN